jgi:hypothetical protein
MENYDDVLNQLSSALNTKKVKHSSRDAQVSNKRLEIDLTTYKENVGLSDQEEKVINDFVNEFNRCISEKSLRITDKLVRLQSQMNQEVYEMVYKAIWDNKYEVKTIIVTGNVDALCCGNKNEDPDLVAEDDRCNEENIYGIRNHNLLVSVGFIQNQDGWVKDTKVIRKEFSLDAKIILEETAFYNQIVLTGKEIGIIYWDSVNSPGLRVPAKKLKEYKKWYNTYKVVPAGFESIEDEIYESMRWTWEADTRFKDLIKNSKANVDEKRKSLKDPYIANALSELHGLINKMIQAEYEGISKADMYKELANPDTIDESSKIKEPLSIEDFAGLSNALTKLTTRELNDCAYLLNDVIEVLVTAGTNNSQKDEEISYSGDTTHYFSNNADDNGTTNHFSNSLTDTDFEDDYSEYSEEDNDSAGYDKNEEINKYYDEPWEHYRYFRSLDEENAHFKSSASDLEEYKKMHESDLTTEDRAIIEEVRSELQRSITGETFTISKRLTEVLNKISLEKRPIILLNAIDPYSVRIRTIEIHPDVDTLADPSGVETDVRYYFEKGVTDVVINNIYLELFRLMRFYVNAFNGVYPYSPIFGARIVFRAKIVHDKTTLINKYGEMVLSGDEVKEYLKYIFTTPTLHKDAHLLLYK